MLLVLNAKCNKLLSKGNDFTAIQKQSAGTIGCILRKRAYFVCVTLANHSISLSFPAAVTLGVRNLLMKARISIQRNILTHIPTPVCIELQEIARLFQTHLWMLEGPLLYFPSLLA